MFDRHISDQQKDRLRHLALNQQKSFNKVYLSVSAATKMLNHAVNGVPKQVMGLLQGFYQTNQKQIAFQITDVLYLPVEASETRVTADEETQGLIGLLTQWTIKINTHKIIGWYHSHPSYGCWLSGIDVDTSALYQLINDPFISLVIDPIKSLNFKKLDVGAFRVYNKDHRQLNCPKKDVPRRKVQDFGYHYERYYELPVSLYVEKQTQKHQRTFKSFSGVQSYQIVSFSVSLTF